MTVALVAGAVGRLGEALLNAVLSRGGYHEVVALAESPMALGIRHLSLADIDALPELDDVYLSLSSPDAGSSRSFHGRDAPFVLVDTGNCLRIAEHAAARGAKRLLLISPTPAWQQLGSFHRALGNELELALSRLPLQRLVITRPVATDAKAGGNWLQRVVHVYLSLQLLMLPRSIPHQTSEQIARRVILALQRSPDGITVLPADRIEALETDG